MDWWATLVSIQRDFSIWMSFISSTFEESPLFFCVNLCTSCHPVKSLVPSEIPLIEIDELADSEIVCTTDWISFPSTLGPPSVKNKIIGILSESDSDANDIASINAFSMLVLPPAAISSRNSKAWNIDYWVIFHKAYILNHTVWVIQPYLSFNFVFWFGHVLSPGANFITESDDIEIVTFGQGGYNVLDSLHSMG